MRRVAAVTVVAAALLVCATHAQETFSFAEGYIQPSATTGPLYPTWSPDARRLAFAMDGAIWTIDADGGEATQLTAAPTYDTQPQWSPDGRAIAYVGEQGRATEVFVLDVATGASRQLTGFGRVTLDPHWSADNERLVVSSGVTGTWADGGTQFNLFLVPVAGGPAVALTHEPAAPGGFYPVLSIQPSFTPDGRSVVFMSRRQPVDAAPVQGSGWIWRIPVTGGAPALVHAEETLYQARPVASPDGSRIAFISSRRGRNTLSIVPAGGGEPIPVTRNTAEEFMPAWSPDGSRLAFVDNSDGGRSVLWVIGANGGSPRRVEIRSRRYRYPTGRLSVTLTNASGDRAARLYLRASDGKTYVPVRSFHRVQPATGDHYTHVEDAFTVTLPTGPATLEVRKGFEYAPATESVDIRPDETTTATVALRRIVDMPARGWWSGDNHVHAAYGGVLEIAPPTIAAMARAEDLHVVHDLICNRENRIFDLPYFEGRPHALSTADRILYYSEEYRPSFYGHMGLLGLKQLVWPFYNGQRGMAWGPHFPTNADALDMAHAAGGWGGAWHLFNYAADPSEADYANARELPVDVALGKTDFVEILSLWSNHLTNVKVWYKLLNLGFHVPITSGTDSFPSFDRNPAIGGARVYAHAGATLTYDAWMRALREGRSFVTSGPLLQFTVEGHEPGETLTLPPSGAARVTVQVRVDAIVPMRTLTVVRNGEPVATLDVSRTPGGHAELTRTIDVPASGWLAARIDGDGEPHHGVMKSAVFAHTAPVYVMRGTARPRDPETVRYFLRWIDRSLELLDAETDWHSPADKQHAIDVFRQGRRVYEQLLAERPATARNP